MKSQNDVTILQRDLDSVTGWAAAWKMNLNATKCKSFKISLKRNLINSAYKIDGTILENVSAMKDLGVILDQKLTFSDHISSIVSKANRSLGLLIRSFQAAAPRCRLEKKALIAAYNANVRSILEYCPVIWAGAAKCHLDRVERVQHKFLIWLANHADPTCPSLDYDELMKFYNVRALQARRVQHDILFIYKVFRGLISSSHLLECLSLHVPARVTRNAPVTLLNVPYGRVNTVQSSVFVRGPRAVNDFLAFSPTSDIFNDPVGRFKRRVISFTTPRETVLGQ